MPLTRFLYEHQYQVGPVGRTMCSQKSAMQIPNMSHSTIRCPTIMGISQCSKWPTACLRSEHQNVQYPFPIYLLSSIATSQQPQLLHPSSLIFLFYFCMVIKPQPLDFKINCLKKCAHLLALFFEHFIKTYFYSIASPHNEKEKSPYQFYFSPHPPTCSSLSFFSFLIWFWSNKQEI